MEPFHNFFVCGSKLSFNSHILSTAITQSDQSNYIKLTGRHNQSDMNDVVHVQTVQFYFDQNFQPSMQYH